MEQRQYEGLALASVLSNLAKACTKQQRPREASLLTQLSDQSASHEKRPAEASLAVLESGIAIDLEKHYALAYGTAESAGDRGALRALTWGKKVTSIHKSLLTRYKKQQDALVEGSGVYVCEACGFIAISAEVPQLCPICKAPSSRFLTIQ